MLLNPALSRLWILIVKPFLAVYQKVAATFGLLLVRKLTFHFKLLNPTQPNLTNSYHFKPLVQLFFRLHGDDPEESEDHCIDRTIVLTCDIKNAVTWDVKTILERLKFLLNCAEC